MQRIKIFTLPYAAGTASIYYNMKKYLYNIADIVPIELPGHGSKYIQPLCKTIQEMAEYVFYEILNELDEPYCLMGYSMGSLIEYELYNIINNTGVRKPEQMFLFAADAPHIGKSEQDFQSMSNESIIKKLKDLNGTVKSVFENEELMELVIPIARADFSALEEYIPTILKAPIDCSGFIMKGNNDTYCIDSMNEWKRYFSGDLVIKEGMGDRKSVV